MKGNCTLLERWNGATWDLVSKRFSISGGDRDREVIEDDAFLDCPEGEGAECGDYKRRAPGSKMLGELTAEVAWNPRQDQDNPEKHHLFFQDYDSCEETYWRIRYPNEEATGEIYHAFIKALSRSDIQADETIRLTATLQPTGKFYTIADNITAVAVEGIPAPANSTL